MSRKRWIASAVAVLALLAVALPWWLRKEPLECLVDAAARDGRVLEARLTGGFHWFPIAGAQRKQIRLNADELETLQRSASRHVDALTRALTGNRRDALNRLTALAATPAADAKVWSDLAAIRYEVAVAEEDAALLPHALAAADAAVRLTPQLPEALFNRAVILERLGFRDLAREAWERYLASDPETAWASEARERIRALAPLPLFHEYLDKNYDRLASDPRAAHELARTHPHESRLYGETLILGRWAEAETAGNRGAADKHLRLARELGAELLRNRREGMLQAAVAAIDRAGMEQRRQIVRGHILFREAQNHFKVDRAAAAQPIFVNAVRELEAGGSPVALLASFYLAHTHRALGNRPEARRRELQLLQSAPAEFPAHRAQVLWHLGLGYQGDGEWGKAMAAFEESVAIFERLGEQSYAANVRGLIAEVHDRTGDPQSAWAQRIIALQGIGKWTTSRLLLSLGSLSRGAMLRKEWAVAISFLDLASATAKSIDRPVVEAEMRLLMARANARTGNASESAKAIAAARAAVSRIDDPAARQEVTSDVVATEAVVAADPHVAIRVATQAIEYESSASGRRIVLPELFLSRGRARKQLRDREAMADFEAGIAEVEKHRESLPSGDSRWGSLEAAQELFEEAIAFAMERGEVDRAFAYAERMRARELLEALGAPVPALSLASIDANTAVVEYVALPDRLIIFVARRDGVRAVESRIDRATLERAAKQYDRALAAQLLAPIESEIATSELLVFIPGPSLAAVPFAALPMRDGRYLVESHAIVVSPSAAVFARLAARKRPAHGKVLVVANPELGEEWEALPEAEREGAAVAAMYGRSTQLTRTRATLASFRGSAADAEVIHFATHGTVPAAARGGGALLLADGHLDSLSIASIRLPRTTTVVLAACDSARGPLRAEGTISVARAFLAAGVPEVAATLWRINDEASAEFFPRVHRHLVSGLPLARAIREAQRESIRRGESPVAWAAVQAMGS